MSAPSTDEDPRDEASAALKEAKKAQKRIATKVTYWTQSAKDIENVKAANHFVDLIRDAILPHGPQRTQGSS